jgi:hypothetical protein
MPTVALPATTGGGAAACSGVEDPPPPQAEIKLASNMVAAKVRELFILIFPDKFD